MGYPMTMRRFVNRNRLTVGDYHDPGEHGLRVNLRSPGLSKLDPDSAEWFAQNGNTWRERLEQYENAAKSLLGDLRRLERDAIDERAICPEITRRTGIDADVVAAVLKEFFSI